MKRRRIKYENADRKSGMRGGIYALWTVLVMCAAFYGSAQAATLTVTNTNDSGPGSLRQAILDAPGAPGPSDIINISATGTILLQSQLDIDKDLNINGPGAGSLSIDGQNLHRVFNIGGTNSSAAVSLSGMTIQRGFVQNTVPTITQSDKQVRTQALVVPGGEGAGIRNYGLLGLYDVVITNNEADFGGGIANFNILITTRVWISNNRAGYGAGLFNQGSAASSQTAYSGNTVGFDGGAIYNNIVMTDCTGILLDVTASTLSGNNAGGSGGAIDNHCPAVLDYVTIYGNTATNGGGIRNDSGNATIRNTIVAGNTGGNCAGTAFDSLGYNLEDANGCGFASTGDLANTDPNLGPLQINGGTTPTHALLSGSPAIDAGDPAGGLPFDQRDIARPQGVRADIGAYEFVPAAALAPTSVPTMNEWGMLIFILCAGMGAAYNMRRFRRG